MSAINVLKRNGTKEPLDIEKIHKVVEWACEDITGVSVSEIELKSQIQFYNNIKSSDIHETLIRATAELITEDTPNYQYVAGRLINYHLRKQAYSDFNPPHLLTQYRNVRDLGYYDPQIGELYTEEEFEILNKYIKHDRDNQIVYVGMEQLRSKYLVKDRTTDKIFETPQMAFMLIAMTLFSGYKKDRLKWVKELYDALSEFDISLPTPIMAGVRTPDRQYSSCVLIETGDSIDSINATASAITKYVSQKAGIGIGAGRIRALKSAIRNGSAYHTGVIPFFKFFAAAVKSCNQGGVRGGSATLHVPIWHYEIEDILVLRNNKGTEETRCRQLDYSIQFNELFYERLITGGDITLFSPSDVGDMYDYFFTDPEKFKEIYEKLERSTKIRKKTIKAVDLFSQFMGERKDTGRIYFMNVDHCNTHSSFASWIAITMSNLCQEITLPTSPLDNILDENGEISQCILAAQNWGKIKTPADFERGATLIVRALNALIDYQSYPVIAGELSTKARRPLGVGIINFAYWLAKNGTNYSNPDLELIHEYAEAWSYYLIKASVDLAEENGHCAKSSDTKYHEGIFPIDTYKKDVDDLVAPVYKMDWETLKARAKKYGIMNSTLMALMPSETSSQVSNSTNGIDPIRELVSVKQSKDGVLKQVAPEPIKLKNKYEKLWDQERPYGYITVMAVLQKFIDQSISTNTTYNPVFYEDDKIPMSEMLKDMLIMYKYGIKTGYYLNTNDHAGEIVIEDDIFEEEIEDQDACDSCMI